MYDICSTFRIYVANDILVPNDSYSLVGFNILHCGRTSLTSRILAMSLKHVGTNA